MSLRLGTLKILMSRYKKSAGQNNYLEGNINVCNKFYDFHNSARLTQNQKRVRGSPKSAGFIAWEQKIPTKLHPNINVDIFPCEAKWGGINRLVPQEEKLPRQIYACFIKPQSLCIAPFQLGICFAAVSLHSAQPISQATNYTAYPQSRSSE